MPTAAISLVFGQSFFQHKNMQPQTRVYLDLQADDKKMSYSSKYLGEKFEHLPEELMSVLCVGINRATRRGGLGLSIARSLTELQGGLFNM